MSNGVLLKSGMLLVGEGLLKEQQPDGNILLKNTAVMSGTTVEEYRFQVTDDTTSVEITFATLGITERPVFSTYFVKESGTNTYEMVAPNVDMLPDRFMFHMDGFTAGTYLILYTSGVSLVRHRRDAVVTPLRDDGNGTQCVWLDDANGRNYLQTHTYRYDADTVKLLIKSGQDGINGDIALKVMVDDEVITTVAVPCSSVVTPYTFSVPAFRGTLRLERDMTSPLDTLKDGDNLVVTALIYDIVTEGGF